MPTFRTDAPMQTLPLYKLDPLFTPRSDRELPPLRDDLISSTNVQSIAKLLEILFGLNADRVRICEDGAVLECSERLLAREAGSLDRLPQVALGLQEWLAAWAESGRPPADCKWSIELGVPEHRVWDMTHRLANELAHPNQTRVIRIPLLGVVLEIPPARRLLPPTEGPTRPSKECEEVVSGVRAYALYQSATGQLVHVPLEEATSPTLEVDPSRVERKVIRTAKRRDGSE